VSYSTINQCANDPAFASRVQSCVAQEQLARDMPVDPGTLTNTMTWAVAAATDVEAAYASALAASNPNPGGDESVIADAMILAHVQAEWPTAP